MPDPSPRFPALTFTLATPATPGTSTPTSLHLPRRCAAPGYLGAATSHLARRVCVRCAAWSVARPRAEGRTAAPRQPVSVQAWSEAVSLIRVGISVTVLRTVSVIGAEGVSNCPRAPAEPAPPARARRARRPARDSDWAVDHTRPRRGGDEWPRNKTIAFITKPYTLSCNATVRRGGEGRGEGVARLSIEHGAAVRGGW